MNINKFDLGSLLKKRRMELGIPLQMIAKELGYTKSFVSQVENSNGRTLPPLETVYYWAKKLSLNPRKILLTWLWHKLQVAYCEGKSNLQLIKDCDPALRLEKFEEVIKDLNLSDMENGLVKGDIYSAGISAKLDLLSDNSSSQHFMDQNEEWLIETYRHLSTPMQREALQLIKALTHSEVLLADKEFTHIEEDEELTEKKYVLKDLPACINESFPARTAFYQSIKETLQHGSKLKYLLPDCEDVKRNAQLILKQLIKEEKKLSLGWKNNIEFCFCPEDALFKAKNGFEIPLGIYTSKRYDSKGRRIKKGYFFYAKSEGQGLNYQIPKEALLNIDRQFEDKWKTNDKMNAYGLNAYAPGLLATNSLLLELEKERGKEELSVRYLETHNEAQRLWEIDMEAYEETISLEMFYKWWISYKKGIHVLFENNEKIIGAIGIYPISESWLARFQTGNIGESSLDPAMFAKFANRPANNWYISGLVVKVNWRKTIAAATLLKEATLAWAIEAKLKHPVKLWAVAISKQSECLLSRYGFKMVKLGSEMLDGYPLYVRTISKEDVKKLINIFKVA